MDDRLTLATTTGATFLTLAFHVGTGLLAFVTGFIALLARKGGTWHRRTGVVFTWSMIATGFGAAAVSVISGGTPIGGVLVAYLVFTAFTTVRPVAGVTRSAERALMALAFAFGSVLVWGGVKALEQPGNQLAGVPAGMIFFLATVALLAAIGDARMIHAGGITGSKRLARHLWRMCFALFIASGSFLLGQMRFIPEPIRNVPALFVLALSPLGFLLYWMWRVRLRKNVWGLVTARPVEEPRAA